MKTNIIGQTVVILDRVGSTNNYATVQVRENEVEEGAVFLAVDQNEGRGQQTNRWESEAKKNITCSIVLKPDFLEIADQFMLSKAVCLGISDYLSTHVDSVQVKWPNDIYVGDRKICGILIENSIMNGRFSTSIVGIGLNINQGEFISDAPNPVSLYQLTGNELDVNSEFEKLCEAIDAYYCALIDGKYQEISACFEAKLYRKGEWHFYTDETHRYKGRILGVNKIGQLRIEEQGGPVHEYHFKEVAFDMQN